MKLKKLILVSIPSLALLTVSSSSFSMMRAAGKIPGRAKKFLRAGLGFTRATHSLPRSLLSRTGLAPTHTTAHGQIRFHSTHSSNLDLDKKKTAQLRWESSKGLYKVAKDILAVGRQMHVAINWHLEAYSKQSIIEYVDQNGQTALHITAERSSCQSFRDLLAAVDQEGINKRDKKGNTALHAAIAAKSKYGIQALVYVTDLSLTNNQGQTPQSLASQDPRTGEWFAEALKASRHLRRLREIAEV